MELRGSRAWLLALAVVCAMMRDCCGDSASETAEAVAEEKSDTLLVLGLTAAAVVVLVLLCAIWKLCCGKKAVADTYRNKEDPNQETELEHFTRRHPPTLLAPDPRRIKWKTGVQMLLHIDVANNPPTFTGMVASPTGANANLRTLASSAGMAHEHALLFGLENPHAQTTEKSTHGGKRTEQYLLHPVMTFQADRPLHPPTLQLHTDVYYEVTIDHIDEAMPGCTVAIGWATSPYPFDHLPGLCDYSIALMTHNGSVYASGFQRACSYFPPTAHVRHGDTIGAGYRWVPTKKGSGSQCEFFFTLNGKQFHAVPHLIMPTNDNNVEGEWGSVSPAERLAFNTGWQKTPAAQLVKGGKSLHHIDAQVKKMRDHQADAPLKWEKEAGKHHLSQFGTTPDFLPVLGRGAGYPVVGCFGSAKVRFNTEGPFVFKGARGETVHQSFRAPGSHGQDEAKPRGPARAPHTTVEMEHSAVGADDLMSALAEADRTDSWGAAKAEPSAQDLMAAMKQEGW